MWYKRTIKIPIHYETTKKKLYYLDNLTARLTYTVRLFCEKIEEDNKIPRNRKEIRKYSSYVRRETELSSAFIQQAEDKALWMWKQYRKIHGKWEWMLNKAKKETKWYDKLKRREPSKPCFSKDSRLKKIPTRFDYRTGKIEKSSLKLTDWIIRISTLKKFEKMIILLNPSEWHNKRLREANKICDFEIVKKGKKYYVHITCEYEVDAQPIKTIRGVDLGVNRDIASVKLPLTPKNFSLVKAKKEGKLRELNDRTAYLQREQKWEVLKKLRRKRYNVAVDYDRKTAKAFVKGIHEELVVIGNPEYIRYHKFKGDGNKQGRKILQGWSFGRQSNFIIEKCEEKGIHAFKLNEWWTSSKCHKCGGKVKENKRRIECEDCGLKYDREFNSCIKIIQKAMSYLGDKSCELWQNQAGATDELARTVNDSVLKPPMNAEATSKIIDCGGSSHPDPPTENFGVDWKGLKLKWVLDFGNVEVM